MIGPERGGPAEPFRDPGRLEAAECLEREAAVGRHRAVGAVQDQRGAGVRGQDADQLPIGLIRPAVLDGEVRDHEVEASAGERQRLGPRRAHKTDGRVSVHTLGTVVQVAGDNLKAPAGLGRPERDVAAAAADLEHARAGRDACEQLPPEALQRPSGSLIERQRKLRSGGEPLGPGRLRIPATILGRHNAPRWPLA